MEWFGFGRQLSSALVEVWGGLDSCFLSVGYTIMSRDSCGPQLLYYQLDFRPLGGTPMSNSDTGLGVGYLAGWSECALHLADAKEITEVFLQLFLWDLHSFCFSSRRLQVYLNRESSLAPTSPHPFRCPQVCKTPPSSLLGFLPWLLKQESLENSPLSFPESNSKSFSPSSFSYSLSETLTTKLMLMALVVV